jgi:hypothetical protein
MVVITIAIDLHLFIVVILTFLGIIYKRKFLYDERN